MAARDENQPSDLRERILAAARRLLSERPLRELTLAAVARAAGVSRTAVYRHVGHAGQLKELLAQEDRTRRASPDVDPDTRARILAAAAKVFARFGYNGATLDRVAAEAGVTKGAVYWHFASKSDLFLALLAERLRRHLASLPEAASAALRSGDPEEGLAGMLATLFEAVQADPDWPRLYLEYLAHSRDPEVRMQLRAANQVVYEASVGLIGRLQMSGDVATDVDPFVTAVVFTALLDGITLAWLLDPDRVQPQAWAAQLARLLWRGLTPR